MTSEATRRAAVFLEAHLPEATALGRELAELTEDPETFTRTLTAGLERLADPAYAAEQERVAPGSGATIGVRWPLLRAVQAELRTPLKESSSASTLWLAQRLANAEQREVRLFSLPALNHTLPDDPERAWQLMRRLARAATDWISVDSLADTYARGILLEGFRWAEIEQLVYSAHRMERRLVGSTLATLAHRLPSGARRADAVDRYAPQTFALLHLLMGDADDPVQKALSWAVREWSRLVPDRAQTFLQEEAKVAIETADGNRAWVVRDSLANLNATTAAELTAALRGIRRRKDALSTSVASAAASAFLMPTAADVLADQAVAMQGDRFARRSV